MPLMLGNWPHYQKGTACINQKKKMIPITEDQNLI